MKIGLGEKEQFTEQNHNKFLLINIINKAILSQLLPLVEIVFFLMLQAK